MNNYEFENGQQVEGQRQSGIVKWFNGDVGYGFIKRPDTESDVFVHHTAIANYDRLNKKASLAENEEVEFVVIAGRKGAEASNVTGPNGAQVKGCDYPMTNSDSFRGRGRPRGGYSYQFHGQPYQHYGGDGNQRGGGRGGYDRNNQPSRQYEGTGY